MHNNYFNVDDKVSYIGSKYAAEIGNSPGWIIATIKGEDNVFVVDFGIGDGFTMPATVLAHRRDQLKEQDPNSIGGVEVRRQRKRHSEDD